ncbi:DUF3426 domain-containing protein [Phenylobacterium soli]
MILTCPECDTSYFVDDSRIPKAGRMVKCSNCGARWEARNEPTAIIEEEAPADEPAPSPAAEPEPAPVEAAAEPSEPAAADELAPEDVEIVAVEPEADAAGAEAAAEPEPEIAPRPRPAAPPPRNEARGRVALLASMAAVVVALVAGAIAFRGQVVKLVPQSQAAYAGLGLPVNSVGLVIEEVKAEPTFLGGRPVLSVTGSIRNVKGEAVEAPPLRVNLLGRDGKAVAAKVVRPVDARVPAGAVRHFAIAISDPPSNARDLEVVFDLSPQRAAAGPAPAAPEGPAPEGPAPVEAQPLPDATPASLPGEHG